MYIILSRVRTIVAPTRIRHQLMEAGAVTLKVYNVLGQEVVTLVNERQSPGFYRAYWDGSDHEGKAVSSGTYLYRIQAGEFVKVRRMLLLR